MNTHRRKVLTIASLVSAVGIPGCSAFVDSASTTRIEQIQVINFSESTQNIQFHLHDSGETVFEKELELAGVEGDRANRETDFRTFSSGWDDVSTNADITIRNETTADEKSTSLINGEVIEILCGINQEKDIFFRQRELRQTTE